MAPSTSPLFSFFPLSGSPTGRLIGNYCSVSILTIPVFLVRIYNLAYGDCRATYICRIMVNYTLCYLY
ncbi:hypothetical protein BDV59DRAFT_173540 [Aspergillus ambiguus]|uniref:uncharacterized protein n=1 Tax=Aspergillus ambiguus TaxID=176160 RepID=UPI003CCE0735